jgi:hypothetical protein
MRAGIPTFQGDKGRSEPSLTRLRPLPLLIYRREMLAAEFEKPECERDLLTNVLRKS